MATRKKNGRFDLKGYLDRRAASSLRLHAHTQMTLDDVLAIKRRLEARVANCILNHRRQNSVKLIGYLRRQFWTHAKRFNIEIIRP